MVDYDWLRPFFREPKREYGVREIARIWKVVPATAATRLEQLKKAGFLTMRVFRKTHLYTGEGDGFCRAQRNHLIEQLHDKLIPALNEAFWEPVIVLFGSATRGEDVDEIDVLVLTEEPGEFDQKIFEKKLHRRIDLFVHRTLAEISNEHLIFNIVNGVTLQGDATWISESMQPCQTRTGRQASKNSANRKRASSKKR